MPQKSEWSDEIIQQVWEKGTIVAENKPDVWRQDACKAWIRREHYNNRRSQYGWEIDHIVPVSAKGSDDVSNLRPLQWQNNANKKDEKDGRLRCVIVSSGDKNIRVG